jgi:hypothetical protein
LPRAGNAPAFLVVVGKRRTRAYLRFAVFLAAFFLGEALVVLFVVFLAAISVAP